MREKKKEKVINLHHPEKHTYQVLLHIENISGVLQQNAASNLQDRSFEDGPEGIPDDLDLNDSDFSTAPGICTLFKIEAGALGDGECHPDELVGQEKDKEVVQLVWDPANSDQEDHIQAAELAMLEECKQFQMEYG